MKNIDEIFELLQERGHGSYFGEPVSQLEHALQCAHFAEQEDAAPSLVVAALLHDVGHLLHGEDEGVADGGTDMEHELLGDEWLSARFGPEVTQPIKLHVAAKRYLCATDPAYFGKLSPASVQSLKLQGGPMTLAEVAEFAADPFARNGIRLRHWDDLAKDPSLTVEPLSHYRPVLESIAR
jgi:[1-hydroxy-2-(trimethylamino)ethyl]phosphonate dioxygenase